MSEVAKQVGPAWMESGELYRVVFENSAVAITVTDDQERIVLWNHFTETLLGMTSEDLYLRPVSSLYPEEEWEKIRQLHIRQKGIQYHHETRVLRRSRDPIDVDVSLSVIRDAEGHVAGSIGIMKDVSERKVMERALLSEHSRLQALLENIPDSIYFKDLQNRFVLVNPAKASRAHVSEGEMVGKTDFDFLPEEEARRAFEDDQQVLRTGQALVNKVERLTGADGAERWVSVTKIPWHDISGAVIGTMGLSRDVTSWKQTEAQLARERELLQALVQTIPDSIYFKDREHRFVLVNKAKADHWGVTPEVMIGKTDFDFLPKDQAQQAVADETEIMRSGVPILDKVEKITGSDGSERWLSVTKLPRRDASGGIIGTMGISRDITRRVKERKETEKYKKVAIGQNLRMIELRDRVKELINEMDREK